MISFILFSTFCYIYGNGNNGMKPEEGSFDNFGVLLGFPVFFFCSRFLQGAGTDPQDVAQIREALQGNKSYCGRLLNYKKDGTPFWNLLTIAPIKDESGKVLKFIGYFSFFPSSC